VAAALGVVPIVGKFPLNQEALNDYFLLRCPMYVALRSSDVGVPLFVAVSFGVAFPLLYPIALLSLVIGECQDRVNLLRRLRPLPVLSSDSLARLPCGFIFPLALLCRAALLIPMLTPHLEQSATVQRCLLATVLASSVSALLLLADHMRAVSRSPASDQPKPADPEQYADIQESFELSQFETMRATDVGDVTALGEPVTARISLRGPQLFVPDWPVSTLTQLLLADPTVHHS